MVRSALFFAVLLPIAASATAAAVCRTTAALNEVRAKGTPGTIPFDITGTVSCVPVGRLLVVHDETGTAGVSLQTKTPFAATTGDVVRISGNTFLDKGGRRWADVYHATAVGRAATPPAARASVADLTTGRFDFSVVRTSGIIVDVMPDEIDTDFVYAILADGGKTIPVSYNRAETAEIDDALRPLVGARVEVLAYCNPASGNRRRFHTRGLSARLADTHVTSPAAADPFDVPELGNLLYTDPEKIYQLGRRRADGSVLAAWGRRNILIQTGKRLIRAQTPEPADLPAVGAFVRIVGYPETDMFNLNLSGARWRPAEGEPATGEPVRATVRDIVPQDDRRQFAPEWHGKLVTLKGRIRENVPSATAGRLLLSCDGELVSADISACFGQPTDAPVDALVELTGVCLMDVSDWRPAAPFPHIRGFKLVVRSPNDIVVLARPSWWTAGRLLLALGGLLLVTLGIGVWNVLLKRASDRKGREIAEQRMTIVETELKVCERTRLSVELHDALSQTLSAVSMQIDAVRRYLGRDRAKTGEHLDIAAKTIGSCQTELHNCLWDLRNSTLDAADMDEAIRQTVRPHVGEARLDVRVNVPRERLSDNTAHAILRIVRELATNAVKHGQATHVRIAGLVEGDRLMVSVRDNGRGFEPDAAPGIDEGHFGLQGIRERIDELDGEFTIASAPGRGTRAALYLHIPNEPEA